MIPDSELIITISDAREVGGCVAGWKTFVELHGFEWKTVVRDGLTAEQLLSTNDVLAENLVNFVKNRAKL